MEAAAWEAVVLCGGRGTRLRGHIDRLQKTVVEVAGRPFLAWVLKELAAAGCRRCVLAAGVGVQDIRRIWPVLVQEGVDLALHAEPSPLGTGGALAAALNLVQSPQWVLVNGDSLCFLDYKALARCHADKKRPVTAVVAPLPRNRPVDYGMVVMDGDDRVVSFSEKPDQGRASVEKKTKIGMYAGVTWMDERIRSFLPEGPGSFERDLMPRWVAQHLVQGCWVDAPVWDIGTPKRLEQVRGILERGGTKRIRPGDEG